METTTLNKITQGVKFRFEHDSPKTIRTAVQVGRTEIFAPHENSNPHDGESEVYLRNETTLCVILETINEQLAKEFSRILTDQIGSLKIFNIIALNAGEPNPHVCHSHDFCDANMTMDEAFKKVIGKEVNLQSDKSVTIWNNAWSKAKSDKFYFNRSSLIAPTLAALTGGWENVSYQNDLCDSVQLSMGGFILQLFVPNSAIDDYDNEEINTWWLSIWKADKSEPLTDEGIRFATMEAAASTTNLFVKLLKCL